MFIDINFGLYRKDMYVLCGFEFIKKGYIMFLCVQ